MSLPYDVARCSGVADTDTLKPLPMCRDCERFRWLESRGPRTPMFDGTAAVIATYGQHSRLECSQRIKPA